MPLKKMKMTRDEIGESIYDIDLFSKSMSKDDVARIVFLESEPTIAYTHFLNPLENSGFQRGPYHCLAENAAQGGDPDQCPACAWASGTYDVPVANVKLNAQFQIAKYNTNSKGQVQPPVSVHYCLWQTSWTNLNKIVKQMDEQEVPDLLGKDMTVTCKSNQYKNFELMIVVNKASWESSSDGKVSYELARSKIRGDELDRLICQNVEFDEMEKIVRATGAMEEDRDTAEDIDEIQSADSLNDLLGDL
jgi:hypothetical protein